MKYVHIIPDVYDKNTWSSTEVEDLCAYLKQQFSVFPEHTKIYHGHISEQNDVTPKTPLDIVKIQQLEGDFYVVIYPAFLWIPFIISVISAAISIYTFLTMPKPQVSAPQSANNDLASRQNQPRLNGRIPEIFGKLRSTPDLIAAASIYFDEQLREIEECVMVIGRGYHEIHDCREDQTDVNDITGTSVSVYDPHTAINAAPIYRVGESFLDKPVYTLKSKAINGQTLNMPNDQLIESNQIYFEYPNLIKHNGTFNFQSLVANQDSIGIYGADFSINNVQMAGNVIFTPLAQIIIESSLNIQNQNEFKGVLITSALVEFEQDLAEKTYKDLSGQYAVSSVLKSTISGGYRYTISLTNPELINTNWTAIDADKTASAGVQLNHNTEGINLNGTYSISAVTSNSITLNNPAQVNNDWSKLNTLPENSTLGQVAAIRLDKISSQWVGWHNLNLIDSNEIIFNFFFPNGLFYQDSKGGVWDEWIDVIIEYQRINDRNQPVGAVISTTRHIRYKSKSAFGTTVRLSMQFVGPFRFRVARTTPTKNDKTQDLCKIRDVYAAARSEILNYGDVTVVRSKTVGTDGALSLKERKLNLLVTRKLPVDGSGELVATRDAGQALIYLALDRKNGRRSEYEVDIEQIKSEINEIKRYFNSDFAAEFSQTIDDPNLSFEEIAGMIASSCFSECYRFGNKLRLKFEQPQAIPTLLFNHRNKEFNSEKRTYNYGIDKSYDGIELEYTSPIDDARIKYHIPESGLANNPKTIKTSGIRNDAQAKTRAWREWNKLLHHHTNVEFSALSESEVLTRNDLVLVADNTQLETQDGEIEFVDGLVIYTSQPVSLNKAGDYFIHLQLSDGSVEVIKCLPGEDEYQAVLVRPPSKKLIYEDDKLKTNYLIIHDDSASQAFMLSEMTPSDQSNSLVLINYDDRYYENDHGFF